MAARISKAYHPSATETFMNPKQVAYFRQKLEETQAALRAELAAVPPEEADETTLREGDQTDHASAESERDLERLNRERVQLLLRQTERALARLDAGTYGYCEDTGEPIDLRRLMAQPMTSLSLEAQQAREDRARVS